MVILSPAVANSDGEEMLLTMDGAPPSVNIHHDQASVRGAFPEALF